ncbi:hypothetical protein [Cupriavidus basilensis]|uniref:hypothetical protein n=1 Tax=Cupriavidus basilensis TaxID=68895 RepID=UPI003D32C384
MFSEMAHLKGNHVPYKGNTAVVVAAVVEEVDGGILATPGKLPTCKSGGSFRWPTLLPSFY